MPPGPYPHGDGDWHGGYGHGGGPPWLPLAIWAVTVVGPFALGLIAWVFVALFGHEPRPAAAPAPPRTAMELLRERFVLGDIDARTFEDLVGRLLESERWEREQAFLRALPPHLRPSAGEAPRPATVRLILPEETTLPGASASTAPTMSA